MLIALGLVACVTAPAPPPGSAGGRAEMDVDGDGLVTEAELARATAALFAGLNGDRDGFLGPEELAAVPPEPLRGVDANGDGRLSSAEVMARRLDALLAADRDGDGRLSAAELAGAGPGPLPPQPGTSLGAPAAPEPADPVERRRLDYERLSTIEQADLQRRIHAQQLFEQWKQQAGAPAEPGSLADRSGPEIRVASAQRMLMALGYYAGPADGLLGPTTQAAIARFQSEQGLPPTGDVSTILLEHLRQAL